VEDDLGGFFPVGLIAWLVRGTQRTARWNGEAGDKENEQITHESPRASSKELNL
jgi:hypothetical protein